MALVQHHPSLNPEPTPVCSVCIANYNGMQVLGDCIESVLAQIGDVPIEIIVHDDASTDGSAAWVRQHYPDVELLAASENAGFCAANNRMVAQARGEYVLLLNNDAALYRDALVTLLEAANGLPKPGILSLPQYDWRTGELVDRGCLLDPFYNPVPNLDRDRREVAYVIGACLFLPRALWDELGGFPEWIGSIGEDMYLCCLARLRGLPVEVTPISGYRHHQGASFGGNRINEGRMKTTYHRRALSERNRIAVMVICTPTPLAWLLLSLHCLLLVAEGAMLTLLKRNALIWHQVYGSALRHSQQHFGELRAYRRGLQRGRRITLSGYLHGFTLRLRKLELLLRHGLPSLR